MPRTMTVSLDGLTDEQPVTLPVEFDDDEWRTLIQFADEADRLEKTAYLRKGLGPTEHITWDGNGMTFVHDDLPTDDELAALLHRLRPFVLRKNEPIEFGRVLNVLKRRLNHERLRAMLDVRREAFSSKSAQAKVVSRDVVLNADPILMDYLNAHEYHRASDLRMQVDALFEPLPAEHRLYVIVTMLVDKVRAIFSVADLIRWMERGAPGKIHFDKDG